MASYTQYSEYLTREGERFDQVAFNVYGDPYGYEPIIFANPAYRNMATLPAGVKLKIPAIEAAQTRLNNEALPPWKRV